MKRNIIFIWPSWVWKTEWSKAIAKYTWYLCIEMDEKIWKNQNMLRFLDWIPWSDEAEKMWNAFWKPWENPANYRLKENAFLKAEAEEMELLWNELERSDETHICDLTWSAIYCEKEFKKACSLWTVVYLKAWEAQYQRMRENFLKDPKPVCWGSILSEWDEIVSQEWQNPINRLWELYWKLLDKRNESYTKAANIIIPWEMHRDKCNVNNPKSLLNMIY